MTWYSNNGSILVKSMIFNIFMPMIAELASYLARHTQRAIDSIGLPKGSTRKTSVLDYLQLYSGPEFHMHFKYAL